MEEAPASPPCHYRWALWSCSHMAELSPNLTEEERTPHTLLVILPIQFLTGKEQGRPPSQHASDSMSRPHTPRAQGPFCGTQGDDGEVKNMEDGQVGVLPELVLSSCYSPSTHSHSISHVLGLVSQAPSSGLGVKGKTGSAFQDH